MMFDKCGNRVIDAGEGIDVHRDFSIHLVIRTGYATLTYRLGNR